MNIANSATYSDDEELSVTQFKTIVREQYLVLQVDEEAATLGIVRQERVAEMFGPQAPKLAVVRKKKKEA